MSARSTAGLDGAIDEPGEAALIVVGPPKWSNDPENPVPEEDAAVLLAFSENGRVTAYSGKVEYGQGIRSGVCVCRCR